MGKEAAAGKWIAGGQRGGNTAPIPKDGTACRWLAAWQPSLQAVASPDTGTRSFSVSVTLGTFFVCSDMSQSANADELTLHRFALRMSAASKRQNRRLRETDMRPSVAHCPLAAPRTYSGLGIVLLPRSDARRRLCCSEICGERDDCDCDRKASGMK